MLKTGLNSIDGIPVEVERKRTRRINIRISADGTVHLSVPAFWATIAEGEAFLRSKWKWAVEARRKALADSAWAAKPVSPGERAELLALLGAHGEHGGLMPKWAAKLSEPGVSWKLRTMKSQWGSCNWRKRLVTLNTELARAPAELAEYVVVHELTHLKAHGHGKDFQALMDERLPGWRELRARLARRDGFRNDPPEERGAGAIAAAVASGRFTGATMDSRLVKPGMLYVALKGEKADGHDFVAKAFESGAALALVRCGWTPPQGVEESRLLRVPDVRTGLGDIAREYRRMLRAKVVGVTGSAGKTTVKELTAAFLRAGGFRTHATAGNFNNDLGLPLTILNCPRDAEFLVAEMGTNHPGEIKYLCGIAAPDVGLVSSIGNAHIEFFGSQDGIAEEKGTLLASLPRSGFSVLAAENAKYAKLAAMSSAPVETVSLEDAEAAAFAEALAFRLPGRHNVVNAMIAYGCARRFGVTLRQCLGALDGFSLPGGRWRNVVRGGVRYIDDTYNANPAAMAAALETFASLPCEGRRIAVLGDMFELGAESAALHAETGRLARSLPIAEIVTVGPLANAGIRGDVQCADAAEAREVLASLAKPGDIVLLKASHGVHLDVILA